MPEAWGNANAVDLLRDMLVQERTDAPATVDSKTTLHLLAGLPAEWMAKVGDVASVERTPTTLGTVVSVEGDANVGDDAASGIRSGQRARRIPLCMCRLPEGTQVGLGATVDGKEIPMSAVRLAAERAAGDCRGWGACASG